MAQNRVSIPLAVMLLPWAVSTAANATAPTGVASAEVDQIGVIEAQVVPGGGEVVVHGTRPAIFSVYRLTDPDRIVLDLAGADVSRATPPAHPVIDGVTSISAVQFQKEGSRVGRVVLDAPASMEVDARVRGNDVLLALTTPGGMGPPGLLQGSEQSYLMGTDKDGGGAFGASQQDAGAELLTLIQEDGRSHIVPAQADGGALALPPAGPEDHLVDRREDLHPAAHPGHRVLSATAERKKGQIVLTVRTDGPVGDVAILRLQDPPRVAVDLPGMSVKGAKGTPREGLLGIRFGAIENGGRVVFDLAGAPVPPEVQLHRVKSGLALSLGGPPEPAPLRVVEEAAPVAPKSVVRLVSVRDLQIVGNASREQVVIDLPAVPGQELPKVDADPAGTFQLKLEGAGLPGRFQRTLDASELGGPINTVSSYNVDAQECRVVVAAAPGTRQELKREGNRLVWSFLPASAAGAPPPEPPSAQESAGRAAGYSTTAAQARAMVLGRPKYTGRRISMEFQDIELVNLLRLFAEISHRNIVVSDDVKGRVTLSLRDVPWDQAFALILETHALGKEESGNIIRVAPQAALEKERRAALDAQKSMQQLEPLRIRLIPVNYALASEVSDKIKDVLSERGVVTVDARTNVLIVKDVSENLTKAEGMVRNLDTQTPQVLIESRIVEAATTFTRELGIQWGGTAGFSPATGNPTGLVFPSTAVVSGAAGGIPNLGTAANPNFAVNLPAAIGPGSGGGLGFIFGSAGGAFNLNLRLSAMESNGVVKTVSAPKVATLDNQEADISQGLSIPFAQVSAAGVQTQFVEARLELKVTPHVTSDGSVLMKISATNNHPDPGITGANGQPAISRKEAKTQMLVRDGDTTVIGGIYTRDTGLAVNEVPFFGKIPVLGWLFKHRSETENRTELLIFITPRILNRQQVVSAGG